MLLKIDKPYMNKLLQISGAAGSFGAWVAAHIETFNVYLQTASLIVGIAIGVWALVDKMKRRCGRK